MKRNTIVEIITALLIVLFVYAALSKLLAYQLFVAQLHTHPYLKHFGGFIAWSLPLTEFIVAVLLIFSPTRLASLYASVILLMIFTIYLVLMLLSGKDLPCSCGGVINGLNWKQHIVFNIGFTGLAITGIVLEKKQNKQTASLEESVLAKDIVATKPLPGIGSRK